MAATGQCDINSVLCNIVASRDHWVDESEEDGSSRNNNFCRSPAPNFIGRLLAFDHPSFWRLWPRLGNLGVALGHNFESGSLNFPHGFDDEDDEGDNDAGDQPDVDVFKVSCERTWTSLSILLEWTAAPLWLIRKPKHKTTFHLNIY